MLVFELTSSLMTRQRKVSPGHCWRVSVCLDFSKDLEPFIDVSFKKSPTFNQQADVKMTGNASSPPASLTILNNIYINHHLKQEKQKNFFWTSVFVSIEQSSQSLRVVKLWVNHFLPELTLWVNLSQIFLGKNTFIYILFLIFYFFGSCVWKAPKSRQIGVFHKEACSFESDFCRLFPSLPSYPAVKIEN